ncbi:glycosyltransferase family 2 protein, partial [Cribrihabitans sp. XS_ASV171]
ENIDLRGYDTELFGSPELTEEIRTAFGFADTIGKAEPQAHPALPSAATLSRMRQFNEILLRYLADGRRHVPRQLWRGLLSEMALPGDPPDPASLGAISRRFHAANLALADDHGIDPGLFALPPEAAEWQEAPPERGFRASQYLLAARFRIDKASKEKYATRAGELGTRIEVAPLPAPAAPEPPTPPGLSDTARAILPPLAVQKFESLRTTSYAPHNKIGAIDEEQLAAAYD